MSKEYKAIAVIFGLLAFIGAFIYCIDAYGFLLGAGVGWIPSLIFGVLVGIFWPIVLVAIAALFWFGSR